MEALALAITVAVDGSDRAIKSDQGLGSYRGNHVPGVNQSLGTGLGENVESLGQPLDMVVSIRYQGYLQPKPPQRGYERVT